MLGKTSWYSIDVSGNDGHILLFYQKCHFCHLLPFAKVGQNAWGENPSTCVKDNVYVKQLMWFVCKKKKSHNKFTCFGFIDVQCILQVWICAQCHTPSVPPPTQKKKKKSHCIHVLENLHINKVVQSLTYMYTHVNTNSEAVLTDK